MNTAFKTVNILSIITILLLFAGCADKPEGATHATSISSATQEANTISTPATTPGIQLDPNLQSSTGIPSPEEIKILEDLQSKVPYPVLVPTYLPGSNYHLSPELIGSSGPTKIDPVGYYSYRYVDPNNPEHEITFNQSKSNNKSLQGFFLTGIDINGTLFQVYWISASENLPAGGPVQKDFVGDAVAFVIIWKGQFIDATGQARDLFYSLTSGTTAGNSWPEIRRLLESLKPLQQVGQ